MAVRDELVRNMPVKEVPVRDVSVYEACPVYKTSFFILRLVEMDDAEDLLTCYSDRNAVSRMNTDCCTSDFYSHVQGTERAGLPVQQAAATRASKNAAADSVFYFTTVEEMKDCIDFWLREYERRSFVRFAVISRETGRAAGTVEIFGGEIGVLRIDLASACDKEQFVEELVRLAVFQLIRMFRIKSLKIKVSNITNRVPLLEKYGFTPSETFRPEQGYYERTASHIFDSRKGMAFCGLACCLCSENLKCAGCRPELETREKQKGKENERCSDQNTCKSYRCCTEKCLDGCWKCSEFPCNNSMFDKLRVKAFARYAAEHGEEELMRALEGNEKNGIIYHYPG